MKHFDCDYMEGAHPLVMQRLLETNLEQTTGYGSDDYTAKAKQLIREAAEAMNSTFIYWWAERRQTRP